MPEDDGLLPRQILAALGCRGDGLGHQGIKAVRSHQHIERSRGGATGRGDRRPQGLGALVTLREHRRSPEQRLIDQFGRHVARQADEDDRVAPAVVRPLPGQVVERDVQVPDAGRDVAGGSPADRNDAMLARHPRRT